MVVRYDRSETEFVNGCCFLLFLLMLLILVFDANVKAHDDYVQNVSDHTNRL